MKSWSVIYDKFLFLVHIKILGLNHGMYFPLIYR